MTFWDFIDRRTPDARGWIGLGSYLLVAVLLLMIWEDRTLLRDDFFKVIATAIILTGWNGGPLSWAYSATKSGGELADRNATLVEEQARSSPPIADDDGGKK